MLAEMARAFNLGLGLNGSASSNAPVFGGFNPPPHHRIRAGADPDNATEREPPPEGSFERFLVELQSDLRVALSTDSTNQNHADEAEQAATTTARRSSAQSLVPTEPADSVHSSDDPDMPALQDVTDGSSSEGDDDDGTF
jgi:hypothetical protein